MIGLARCAYEEGKYKECDLWYGTVYEQDRKLARQYSYLGGFEQVVGRSFSLADRLENTVWLNSTDSTVKKSSTLSSTTQLASVPTEVKIQEKIPVEESPVNDLAGTTAVAVLPATTTTDSEEDEEEEQGTAGAGPEPDPAIVEALSLADELIFDTDTESITLAEPEPFVVPEALEGPLEEELAITEEAPVVQNEASIAQVSEGNLESSQSERLAEALEAPLEDSSLIAEIDTLVVTEESLAIAQEVPSQEDLPIASEIAQITEPEDEEEDFDDTPYSGISSQLDFGLLSLEDLVALAEDSIEENGETLDDFEIPQSHLSVLEDKLVLEEPEPTPASKPTAVTEPKPQAIAAASKPNSTTVVEDKSAVAEDKSAVAEALEAQLEDHLESKSVEIASKEPVDTIGETLEDLAEQIALAPVLEQPQEPQIEEKPEETLSATPQTATTSVLTDIPMRAVPRFTEQPSEQWAPKEAYTAETIPGMRSFEEEMGSFQNEKAFLYKDEFSFSVNPGEEIDETEQEDEKILTTLEVNPFASFLPEEEVEKMEEITSFKMDSPVAVSISTDVLEKESVVVSVQEITAVPEALEKPLEEDTTPLEEEPVAEEPIVVPEALEGPLEEQTNEEDSSSLKKKSNKPLYIGLAALAAAIAALFSVLKKRGKKND